MRVSQFFSVDTAKSLVRMNEYYPDLMERIIRREPNAYLASLYWDSEMFGKSTKGRRKIETEEDTRDYRAELIALLSDIPANFPNKHARKIAERYRKFFLQAGTTATARDCKEIYLGLISGDPKGRTLRALYQRIWGGYIKEAKKEGGRTNGR